MTRDIWLRWLLSVFPFYFFTVSVTLLERKFEFIMSTTKLQKSNFRSSTVQSPKPFITVTAPEYYWTTFRFFDVDSSSVIISRSWQRGIWLLYQVIACLMLYSSPVFRSESNFLTTSHFFYIDFSFTVPPLLFPTRHLVTQPRSFSAAVAVREELQQNQNFPQEEDKRQRTWQRL